MENLSQISISKFSLITRLTTRALRLYDKKGVLIPNEIDPITGYRFYSINQIEKGIKIKMLVTLGFNLDSIPLILEAAEHERIEILNQFLFKKLLETQLEIQRLRKIEEFLINKENSLQLFYSRTSQPVIKNIPRLRIISISKSGDYKIIPKLVQELIFEIGLPINQQNFVKITGPIIFFCKDREFKKQENNFEIAIPIQGKFSIQSDQIELKIIPPGRVISSLYTGPYTEVHQAYTRNYEYSLKNNNEIVGSVRELYLNDPMKTPEQELLTEIQIPIK